MPRTTFSPFEVDLSELSYHIETIESRPFAQNAYVLTRDDRPDAIVVDPGFDLESIHRVLKNKNKIVCAVLNTHGHADHIAGNLGMKQSWPAAPLMIGANDAPLLVDPDLNLSSSFGFSLRSPTADRLLMDREVFGVAGFQFEVHEIPGHSPGSVVFHCKDFDPGFVIGGDVIFAGSVGRTDLAYGDVEQLYRGIRERLFVLPESTVIWPGHGPRTTVGVEKRSNPFVGDSPWTHRLD